MRLSGPATLVLPLGALLLLGAPDQAVFAALPEPGGATGGIGQVWRDLVLFILETQRELHRSLAAALRALRQDQSLAAAWALVLLSFLYGVFHAAGPGHGKAVISAYLLTHESQVRRGVAIAVAAALIQGLTAILLVEAVRALAGLTARDAQDAVGFLETVSYGLIAVIGAALAWRAMAALVRGLAKARGGAGRGQAVPACDRGGCPAHHVAPAIDGSARQDLRAAVAMALSVGIRPCSGAILVLLFAQALDLRLAGIGAVAAMSFGTALAVSALALLAVYGRRLAAGLARWQGGRWAAAGQYFGAGVGVLGGVSIAALGTLLFLGSLRASHPLF